MRVRTRWTRSTVGLQTTVRLAVNTVSEQRHDAGDADSISSVQAALTKALNQVRSINELESETERLRMAQQCATTSHFCSVSVAGLSSGLQDVMNIVGNSVLEHQEVCRRFCQTQLCMFI